MEKFVVVVFEKSAEVGISDAVSAMLMSAGCEGIDETSKQAKAYFSIDNFDEASIAKVFSAFNLSYAIEELSNKNWNAEWEASFQPVTVGSFAGVRASFHSPLKNVAHEIIITPKMSFGTGHHATTFLMMEQMQTIPFQGNNVFDFGTGTGVLAILSEKLGAQHVWATDNDKWSMDNAMENLRENNASKITLEQKDDVYADKTFDIILANINKNTLLTYASDLYEALANDGRIVLSGILVADEFAIASKYRDQGFTLLSRAEKDGWLAIVCTK